jgi:hypothetical protein
MSRAHNPSEQLQLFLDATKAYAEGNFEMFNTKFAEVSRTILSSITWPNASQDFNREMTPKTLDFPGNTAGKAESSAEFMASMKGSRQSVFGEDFKVRHLMLNRSFALADHQPCANEDNRSRDG